jgi:radical SAM protein with 4Fe4S-binding SPASM domain
MPNFYSLLISGGEPFLRGDLPEICYQFYNNNKVKNISIPTNGLLPETIEKTTKEICRKCLHANIMINLSIDGVGKCHDEIRGVKGNFDKLIKTYHRLKMVRKDISNLNIGVNITMSSYNQDKLKEIYNFIKNRLDIDNINFNIVRGDTRKNAKNIDIKNYENFIKILEKEHLYKHYNKTLSKLNKKKDVLKRRIILNTMKFKRMIIPCKAGTLSIVIDETGRVFPCEMLNEKLGDLRYVNYDFNKIWKSDEAKKIRKRIKKNNCYCTYECAMATNLIGNPKYLLFRLVD